MRLGAVILAAGAATRMGSTKQLLQFRGRTLVEGAIFEAQQAGFVPVVVVLGARADEVGQAVARTSAETVVNHNWASGMGSSIKAGMAKIPPDVEGVAILLSDQPFVTAEHLSQMALLFRSPILAARYAGTVGVPALFRREVFATLQQMPDDAGARDLLRGGDVAVEPFDLPEAATDIDTPADFAAL
jgi:molybdenum cofactor cytidylyltransferase